MRKRVGGLGAAAIVAALGTAQLADAVTTKSWVVTTFRDFDEGESKGVLVGSTGEIQAGLASKRTDLGAPLAMTSLMAGARTYLGTGDEGAVLVFEGGKVKPFAKLDGVTIVASLALSTDGKTLFAGGTPGGVVWSINVADGKASKLSTLEEGAHIWAIVPVPGANKLHVGTGPEGKLYEVDVAGGKAKVLWESGKKHLLSVVRDGESLLVGASDDAELYRVDPRTGTARAVHDFSGQEIKSIAVVDKAIYLTVNEFQGAATGSVSGPAKPTGTKPKGEAGTAGGTTVPRTGERRGKGTLWRIDADGRLDQLHALSDTYFTDLFVATGGDVYAATGGAGKIYLIKGSDRTVTAVFDVDERQVLTMAGTRGAKAPALFATGDSGAIYEVGGNRNDAMYTSKVYEADSTTRWGGVRFSGAGLDSGAAIETRSGNTASADKTWSGWSKLAGVRKAPGGAHLAKVSSPAARYLQWRVKFSGSAVLRDFAVYMLPQNQRARVTEVSGGSEPTSGKKALTTTQSGTTKSPNPVTKLRWKIENGDDDDVTFKLEYRVEGELAWRELPTGTGKEPFTRTDFDWNTEFMPDGSYELRVTASDERANPPDLALSDSMVSRPFLVDNRKPEVVDLKRTGGVITGRARDSFSRVTELAYSVDDGDWQVAFSKDGVFDDVVEDFTFKLPADLKPGLHTVVVRAADEGDNVGAAQLSFRTP